MEDDHRSWGLSLSLSLPHQPSPPRSHPPPPVEYTPLPFPTRRGQQTHSFLPSYPPHPTPPSTPYEPAPHDEDEDEPEEHEGSQSSPTCDSNNDEGDGDDDDDDDNIKPPFPWATCKPATVHTMQYLLSHGLTMITGKVKCRKCSVERDIGYNLVEKFEKLSKFIRDNEPDMNNRAPGYWENPALPNCESCGNKNCMKPVIDDNNERVNWLFLLLGEMIVCCALKHLKYFCKYTNSHTSGAKSRLIYYTYLGICKQLDPNGPFDS